MHNSKKKNKKTKQMTVKGMVRMGMELLLTCICMNFYKWKVKDVKVVD